MITDRLIERIIELQNPTCVGLDTSFDYLPDDMRAGAKNFSDVAERIFDFNKKLIDTLYDVVPSVKVQIAYYEMYGAEGLKAYEATLKYAAEKGLVVIADAKRNGGERRAVFRVSVRFSDRQRVSRHGRNCALRRGLREARQGDFCAGQNLQSLERRAAEPPARKRNARL